VLGSVSLGLLLTFCFVYFVELGYRFPHIGRFHPSIDDGYGGIC
jgi:hypothetical protein